MIELQLSRGKIAIIDDEDSDLAMFKWTAHKGTNGKWYANRSITLPDGRRKTILLHRVVMGVVDPKVEVDHRNGDGLNCRRHNLRVANKAQNAANKAAHPNNSSGRKGCIWVPSRNKFRARIGVNNKILHIGYFNTIEEAERAYQEAAEHFQGEYAFFKRIQ